MWDVSTSQVPRMTPGDATENKAPAEPCPNLGPTGCMTRNKMVMVKTTMFGVVTPHRITGTGTHRNIKIATICQAPSMCHALCSLGRFRTSFHPQVNTMKEEELSLHFRRGNSGWGVQELGQGLRQEPEWELGPLVVESSLLTIPEI